jgi:hypothetical protein
LFANISDTILSLRLVSLEAKTLTVEFITPSSTGLGLQYVVLNIGNSMFSFSMLRTGQVFIVEVIPIELAAGIRTPARIAVQVSGCNQPELLLNNILLENTAVESSFMTESLLLFVFSSFVNISRVGLANVTARFQCGTKQSSMSRGINVVAGSTPSLFISTVLRDNSSNYVNMVLSSQSSILILENFLIVSNQQHPVTLESSTTRCAPSCFFLFSLLIPPGLSSILFTMQYSAIGILGVQSVSTTITVRSNNESRILRVFPSVLDGRGGQVMFVSVAFASVPAFYLTSSGFNSSIRCQVIAIIDLSSNYSVVYAQLRQMFAQDPQYLDLLVSSISVLEGKPASVVAVLMSPTLPFTRLASKYDTIVEISGNVSSTNGTVRLNLTGRVPAAVQMQPTVTFQNNGILERSAASSFRASGQYFPPIPFTSNIGVASGTAEAPQLIVRSLSWSESTIFFSFQFLRFSPGKFAYVLRFTPESGNFSIAVDLTIIDSENLPVIVSIEPAFAYAYSGIRILNVSIRNAPSSTASAFVERLNCGSVKLLPTSLPNVMTAYIRLNTTVLAVGDSVVSLVFSSESYSGHIKILSMPLKFELLRSAPEVLLCSAGGREVEVLATGPPRIFNVSFLRLSCPFLNPAPAIIWTSLDDILTMRIRVPPQRQ